MPRMMSRLAANEELPSPDIRRGDTAPHAGADRHEVQIWSEFQYLRPNSQHGLGKAARYGAVVIGVTGEEPIRLGTHVLRTDQW